MKVHFIIPFFCLLFSTAASQKVDFVDSSQSGVSFRGLSVVNDSVLWVSGSRGTVGKSVNGGNSFTWMHPPGFEKRDFRDIEAFDSRTAIIMAIDSPANILKTTDGGATWKTVYERHLPGIFLDAMSFKNNQRGVCVGDPINRHFWIVETNNGGNTWQEVPSLLCPTADSGEACFASSGTNLQFAEDNRYEYGFVSGGLQSNLHLVSRSKTGRDITMSLEINKGLTSTGANSFAVKGKNYLVLGGDFMKSASNANNATFSTNGGKTWQPPVQPPMGYKSCVIWKDRKNAIATGLSGTDVSTNGPGSWKHISDMAFHVVQQAKSGSAIFLAGGNGRIGRYVEK